MRRAILGLGLLVLCLLAGTTPALAHGSPVTTAQPVTPEVTTVPTSAPGLPQPAIPAQPIGPSGSFALSSLPLAIDPQCAGSQLPVRGLVSDGMHWMPGDIPSDTCATVLSAPFQGHFSLWTVPPGVWSKVYSIDRSLYGFPSGVLACNWWAFQTRPDYPSSQKIGQTPRVGATIRYAPLVLGAGVDGHLGHVVALYDNGWILTAEMNFTWRGGGANRVLYRFVPGVYPGITYIY